MVAQLHDWEADEHPHMGSPSEPSRGNGVLLWFATDDFDGDGRVDLVLDGGVASGLGATTIDITEPYWRVIKEGAISEKEIAECLEPA